MHLSRLNALRWNFRAQFLLGFAICLSLLTVALYSQLHGGLVPCPLCIFQRIAFAATGLVFLVGGLHVPARPGGRRMYSMLALVAAAAGVGIAGRHVWLQHLPPDQVPMCGPGLNYLLEAMPLAGVVRKVLTGSGECAKVDWTLLGLSMPEWSLLWFLLLATWALYLLLRNP